MKRFLVFISLHLFLFLLVIAYQAQADDEEWTIDKYKSLSYARVSGEIAFYVLIAMAAFVFVFIYVGS